MAKTAPKPEKTKPVFSKRYGKVSVAVWKAESREGLEFFRTTLQNQYKTGEGEWRDSAYSAFDLLNLSRCIADALAFIRTREQSVEERDAAA